MLTDELLRHAVGVQFGPETARCTNLDQSVIETIPSTGGGAFNTTVQRLRGLAGGTAWSVIVKQITVDQTRPGWDREAKVFADGDWLDAHLPVGLVWPRLLAEHQNADTITLVCQDLSSSRPLGLDDLITAATLLSQFNASGADARPWWSTGFLLAEHHTLADHPSRLEHLRSNPRLEQMRHQLIRLAADAPTHLATVGALPLGPAHLDAYSRNLMAGTTPGSVALVDWANAGSAPLGTDPATLFVLTLNYLDAEDTSIVAFERSVVDAMHIGLDLAGAGSTSDEAGAGFHAVARLRHLAMMMNALPMVEREDPAVSAIVGRPLDDIIDRWLDVGDHLLGG